MRVPQPGEIFAGYHVDRNIGEGGFATVFSAVDQRTGVRVALKVLRPGADGTYERATYQRFQREVQLLAVLSDPRTVRLLAHGEDQSGFLWAAFEFVPGRDLSQLIQQEGTLDAASATTVLRQILLSLCEAHAHGLLHRDIKPDNIRVFIGDEGPLTVKVLDFGIARASDGSHPSVTKTGELVGTPRYMSPEQLLGAPLGPESDLYAVGLIGLELVAGPEALHGRQVGEQLDRLRPGFEFQLPDLGDDGRRLVAVIRRLLATDTSTRLVSAESALRALTESTATHGTVQRQSYKIPAIVLILALIAVGAWFGLAAQPEPVQRRPRLRIAPAGLLKSNVEDVLPSEPAPPERKPVTTKEACRVEPGEGVRLLTSADGRRREVFLYVPESFDPNAKPRLVGVFGRGGDEISRANMLSYFRLRPFAEANNVVVVVPLPTSAANFSILGVAAGGAWYNGNDVGGWTDIVAAKLDLCLDSAPVYLLGEHSGASAVARLVERGLPIAGVVTSALYFKRAKWDPKVRAVRRLDLLPAQSTCWRGDEFVERGVVAEAYQKANGCLDAPPNLTPYEHGTCSKYQCDVKLTSCVVDGGRNWVHPPWLVDQSECAGPTVDFPFHQLLFDFLTTDPEWGG